MRRFPLTTHRLDDVVESNGLPLPVAHRAGKTETLLTQPTHLEMAALEQSDPRQSNERVGATSLVTQRAKDRKALLEGGAGHLTITLQEGESSRSQKRLCPSEGRPVRPRRGEQRSKQLPYFRDMSSVLSERPYCPNRL